MQNITAGYGKFSDFNAFFGNFQILLHFGNVLVFIKLSQLSQVQKRKINLCYHLWLRQSNFKLIETEKINKKLSKYFTKKWAKNEHEKEEFRIIKAPT